MNRATGAENWISTAPLSSRRSCWTIWNRLTRLFPRVACRKYSRRAYRFECSAQPGGIVHKGRSMKYRKIGVIGAGVIGVGVAQSLAQTGHLVVLVDISDSILGQARTIIGKELKFAALFDAKAREADHSEVLSRIDFTTDYDRLNEADFVVENSTESWPVKESIYPRLDRICRPDCILAANTSAISITRLGSLTQRADRVIGMHFMNPVPQKSVVEVLKG